MSEEAVSPRGWQRGLMTGPYAFLPFALTADFGFVLNDGAAQHLLALGLPVAQCAFVRFILTAVVLGAYLCYTDPSILKVYRTEHHILWLRGTLNAIALVTLWKSLDYISLSEAITLYNLRPFPTGFVCWWVLNEPFTMRRLIACIVSLAAVVIVVQPDFVFHQHAPSSPHRALGLVLIFVSITFAVGDILLLRKLGDRATTHILFIYCLSGLVLTPIWSVVTRAPFVSISLSTTGLTVLMTIVGSTAQAAFSLSLRHAEGSKISCISYSQVPAHALSDPLEVLMDQIVFSVGIQFVWTGVAPSLLSIVGMVIIIVAGVWCTISEATLESKANSDEYEAIQMEEPEEESRELQPHVGTEGKSDP